MPTTRWFSMSCGPAAASKSVVMARSVRIIWLTPRPSRTVACRGVSTTEGRHRPRGERDKPSSRPRRPKRTRLAWCRTPAGSPRRALRAVNGRIIYRDQRHPLLSTVHRGDSTLRRIQTTHRTGQHHARTRQPIVDFVLLITGTPGSRERDKPWEAMRLGPTELRSEVRAASYRARRPSSRRSLGRFRLLLDRGAPPSADPGTGGSPDGPGGQALGGAVRDDRLDS